jgi:hypothetical protein
VHVEQGEAGHAGARAGGEGERAEARSRDQGEPHT